jgi:predicted nuclease of predicted toxin-antitoxin system
MRVLLDECVDWRLLRDLTDHDTKTVKQLGWEKIKNGALLRAAADQFDVLVTVDKDMPSQHVAVVVLRGRSTRLADLRKLLPTLRGALESPKFGEFQVLSWRDVS